jgi:hypothetical protein
MWKTTADESKPDSTGKVYPTSENVLECLRVLKNSSPKITAQFNLEGITLIIENYFRMNLKDGAISTKWDIVSASGANLFFEFLKFLDIDRIAACRTIAATLKELREECVNITAEVTAILGCKGIDVTSRNSCHVSDQLIFLKMLRDGAIHLARRFDWSHYEIVMVDAVDSGFSSSSPSVIIDRHSYIVTIMQNFTLDELNSRIEAFNQEIKDEREEQLERAAALTRRARLHMDEEDEDDDDDYFDVKEFAKHNREVDKINEANFKMIENDFQKISYIRIMERIYGRDPDELEKIYKNWESEVDKKASKLPDYFEPQNLLEKTMAIEIRERVIMAIAEQDPVFYEQLESQAFNQAIEKYNEMSQKLDMMRFLATYNAEVRLAHIRRRSLPPFKPDHPLIH